MKKFLFILLNCLLLEIATANNFFNALDTAVFFSATVYENSAMRRGRLPFSLTEIQLVGDYQSQRQAVIPQLGDGSTLGAIDVNSQIEREKIAFFGSARYDFGVRRNALFNETSDFLLLFPYVMGDSVGGDVFGQGYRFGGGVAADLPENFIVGASLNYRASIEYRQRDPRPRNVVSDLKADVGFAHDFASHRLGFALKGGRYKQTNALAFYNELGSPEILHFTGLGADYYRFRGKNASTYYEGFSLGGSADLLRKTASGFHASLGYDFFTFEKIITNLNDLPIAQVSENKINFEVGFSSLKNENRWQISFLGEFQNRLGKENIFGDIKDGNYPLLAQISGFQMNKIALSLAGKYQRIFSAATLSLLPKIDLLGVKAVLNSREISFLNLKSGVETQARFGVKKWNFHFALGGFFLPNLKSNLVLPVTNTWSQPTTQIFAQLKNSATLSSAQIQIGFSAPKNFTPYLRLNYDGAFLRNKNQIHQISGALGVAF